MQRWEYYAVYALIDDERPEREKENYDRLLETLQRHSYLVRHRH
jgi:hypothetical protein